MNREDWNVKIGNYVSLFRAHVFSPLELWSFNTHMHMLDPKETWIFRNYVFRDVRLKQIV